MAIAIALGAGAITQSHNYSETIRRRTDSDKAYYLALSGLEKARHKLRTDINYRPEESYQLPGNRRFEIAIDDLDTELFSATVTVNAQVNNAHQALTREVDFRFICGYKVTFTYRGSDVTYGTVTSANESCWLDRNLGASQVATAFDDSQAYGDLFQWGRLDDGHQNRGSGTTQTLSEDDVPGHANFIRSTRDWRDTQNDSLWQGAEGINNPCPPGWRLPTEAEWEAERQSWSSSDRDGAFDSPLKLTAVGRRRWDTSHILNVGGSGRYWSSSVCGSRARRLRFRNDANFDRGSRASGFGVRCIKD